MFKNFTIVLLTCLLITNCGYQKIYNSKDSLYSVSNIDTSGDARSSYLIKNQILINASDDGKHLINIKLKVDKKKDIKERNISNKITKYKLTILANIEISNSNKKINKNFKRTNDYIVGEKHSATILREKTAYKNLTEKVSEDIVTFLNIYLAK